MRKLWLLPAGLAVVTGLGTAVYIQQHEPDYPVRALAFQIMMVGAAMLVAASQRWVRSASLLFLLGGAYVAGMSIGMFYLPTVVVAGLVVARRENENRPSSSLSTRDPKTASSIPNPNLMR